MQRKNVRRFGDFLTRRKKIAEERDWTEAEVERDVMAAIREARKMRTPRRRCRERLGTIAGRPFLVQSARSGPSTPSGADLRGGVRLR
jgi:hypothetical protein